MSSLVVVGAQWGDEGKGKLVDYLTEKADVVVRFQGGNNAGHTLVVADKVFKMHLIPSGILHKNCVCTIAAGVVVDPQVMLTEINTLRAEGVEVNPQRLIIDRDAHIILPYHKLRDNARETSLGAGKIGTTGRGIGPAYEDRAERSGVRFAELTRLSELKPKLEIKTELANAYVKDVLKLDPQVSFDEVWQVIELAAKELLPFVGNVSKLVDEACIQDKKVVFEGAQGTFLDQIHGTIPFVTSSNTIAGAAATCTGVGPKRIQWVLGIAKAYTTRVGSGPFPTELNDEIGEWIRKQGNEFGTTTGRPRRCGWFDAFSMKRSVRLNGIDALAVTKLDILSGLEKIKVCINYRLDGVKLDDMPALSSELESVEPEYIELDGWQEDISQVKKWHDLPQTTRLYLTTIAEIIGCPVAVASVGPERESTIFSSGASFVKNFYA